MQLHTILYLAFAVSMDAFGVSIGIGLNNSLNLFSKLLYCFSFAFFQFLLVFLGAEFGSIFSSYIATIPNFAGGIVLFFVGIFMIKQGNEDKRQLLLKEIKMYYILGISVSIDAMAVGFSVLNKENFNFIFLSSWIIGITTFVLSFFGIKIAKIINKLNFVDRYANYFAGIILILIGIKMIGN